MSIPAISASSVLNVPGGGFSWWGTGKASPWLSAYGLQQLTAMARVIAVDPRISERLGKFLEGRQNAQGWWDDRHMASFPQRRLAVTAYVLWSLAQADYRGPALAKALRYLKEHRGELGGNHYLLALAANAIVENDPRSPLVPELLRDIAASKVLSANACYRTATYGHGRHARIEIVALIAQALIKSATAPEFLAKAIDYLLAQRSPHGDWGSTQATILALQALVAQQAREQESPAINSRIFLNGKQVATWNIDNDNREIGQILVLKPKRATVNEIRIESNRASGKMYQIIANYYRPWPMDSHSPDNPITLTVDYRQRRISVDQELTAEVTMCYNGQHPTFMLIVELGIPPGFSLAPPAFADLLEQRKIENYSIGPDKVVLYLGEVQPQSVFRCRYRLRARYPLNVKTPKSLAYEYYAPDIRRESTPVELTVIANDQ